MPGDERATARRASTSTRSGCSPSRSTSASPQDDRAVSSVPHGTQSYLEGEGGDGAAAGTRAAARPRTRPCRASPSTRRPAALQTQGDPFEPVKIGILIDMDLNQLLADWIDPTILAIEDALNEGVCGRSPVAARHRRRPRPAARELPQGHRRLPLAGRAGLRRRARPDDLGQLAACCRTRPTSSAWPASAGPAPTGSPREYCFTVANGDIPTEGVDVRPVAARPGPRARSGCSGRQGRRARTTPTTSATPRIQLGPDDHPRGEARAQPARAWRTTSPTMRELGAEGIYYGGYGYATFHFAEAFKALDWDPPRVMGTAFMFYSNSNAWAEGLEGWHGVDQLGEDGANPNYNAMVERFEKRFGRSTAQRRRRAGLRHRPRRHPRHRQRRHPAPEQVKEGWSASAGCRPPTAGPGTLHPVRPVGPQGLQGRLPHDPRAARRRAALRRLPPPEWPSNTSSPLLAP